MSDSETKQIPALVGWLDIPVTDLERAAAFYRAVLDRKVDIEHHGPQSVGVIEHGQANGACLVTGTPSRDGVLIYLHADGRLRDAIARAREHGGELLEDVQSLGPYGFRALIADSEGNRVALHSMTEA